MKNCGYSFINLLVIQKYVYSFLNFPKNGISQKLTENSPKPFVLLAVFDYSKNLTLFDTECKKVLGSSY